MTDAPRPPESTEQRLALLARGVQRMADAFGSLEQRLTELADAGRLQALSDRIDEYRVRGRAEVAQVNERIERLETETARAIELLQSIETSVDGTERDVATTIDSSAPMNGLIDAIRGLRDDVAVAVGELRVEMTASIERVITEQNSRLGRLHDALGAARADPSSARLDDLQRVLDEVLTEVRSMRAGGAPGAPAQPVVVDGRLAGIENAIASLRDELAIDRLEASLRDMAEDTSGLRADVRRSFDRVLHEISTSEASLKGEVRAIDTKLSGFGDDLRLVRGLRDGLEALASGVDAVRQLASRGATSAQMGELARDLSTVLAEIESARSQVLAVDQQVGRMHAGAIDLDAGGGREPSAATVAREVEDLERKVTDDIAGLGARIEAIAEKTVTAAQPDDPLAVRLRSLAVSARQLSMGIAEDVRARRASRKPKTRKPVRER